MLQSGSWATAGGRRILKNQNKMSGVGGKAQMYYVGNTLIGRKDIQEMYFLQELNYFH